MLRKLFLGPSGRDADPLVALIGCACRLDNQRYAFLRLQFVGILPETLDAVVAHISTLVQSSAPGSLFKHFGARLILFIGKGVLLVVLQEQRIRLLSVIKFCLA